MTFAKKIFLAVSLSTLIVGSLLIWGAHSYVRKETTKKYLDRYSVLTQVLADTLTRLDLNTEQFMLNSAKVLQERDSKHGLLSNDSLKKLRDELNMSHLFVTDNSGKFIRSTNDDPAVIPNLFSFCPNYKKLVTGGSNVEATPVIKPDPEPLPYKFLSVPSFDRKRIIEVGVRVDFIGKTLAETTRTDSNVIEMALYAPNGTPFGAYNSEGVKFVSESAILPSDFKQVRDNGSNFSFYSKVISSHPKCCQCDISRTSINGEYYYILEAKVSKSELRKVLASTNWIFLGVGILNFVFALILGRLLSRRLVKNIQIASERIQIIKDSGNFNDRIELQGSDEISFLTGEFDRLLGVVEGEKQKAVESERLKAKMQLAREVAHNIKSPIHAIEIMLPLIPTLPERIRSVLHDSVKEIKNLTLKLSKQSEGDGIDVASDAIIFLPAVLTEVVERKSAEYQADPHVKIRFVREEFVGPVFIKADPTNLKAILSNLINNAIEARVSDNVVVNVDLKIKGDCCDVAVRDNGVGIPSEIIDNIGKRRITFKGDKSRGIGLMHAFEKVESWGGQVQVNSKIGLGTEVHLILKMVSSDYFKNQNVNLNAKSSI